MSSILYIKKSVRGHRLKSVPRSPNNNWVVGLTNDLHRRFAEHKHQIGHTPRFWRNFTCNTLAEAQQLETYFRSLGYNAKEGGTAANSVFLYMYYLPRNKHSKTKQKPATP